MKFRGSKKNDKDKEASPTKKETKDDNKELDSVEESLKTDPPKSRFSKFKRSKEHKEKHEKDGEEKEKEEKEKGENEEEAKEDKKEDNNEANQEEKKQLETVDENAESSPTEKSAEEPKPKLRRLNLKRGNKRPASMSAADTKPILTTEEESKLERNDPVRHSYHAGDLPETSQLRKSLYSYF